VTFTHSIGLGTISLTNWLYPTGLPRSSVGSVSGRACGP
jgi:hypothetical protein